MKRLLLFILAGAALCCAQQGARYDGSALFNSSGYARLLPLSQVTVCANTATPGTLLSPCTPGLQVYGDLALTQPLSTPTFFADNNGNFFFYVAPGLYQISVCANGICKNYQDVAIGSTGTTTTTTTTTTTATLSGGSAGRTVCWKTVTSLGYCATTPDSNGACTCSPAALQFSPTTTLAAETGNNTSAVTTRLEITDDRSTVETRRYNLVNSINAPANVSKVSIKKLLYSGATTKVYADVMAWFYDDGQPGTCTSNAGGTGGWGPQRLHSTVEAGHWCVGYVSSSATEVHNQVTDMISRGFDGLIQTWNGVYRPGTKTYRTTDNTGRAFKSDIEARCFGGGSICPFTFAFTPDNSALTSSDGYAGTAAWSGADVNSSTEASFLAKAKDDLCYLNKTYFGSPAYLKIDGKPVYAPFWSLTGTLLTDAMGKLTSFSQNLAANCPAFSSAYNGAPSNGAVSWYVGTDSASFSGKWGLSYNHTNGPINGGYLWENLLSKSSNGRGVQGQDTNVTQSYSSADSFYTAAKATTANAAIGSAWAGFNDQVADWSDSCGDATCSTSCVGSSYPTGCTVYSGRIADYKCGTNLVNSFGRVNAAYSSTNQLNYLRFVTWNDYEEGSAIEAGVDNCYTITSPAAGGGNFTWTMTSSSGNASTSTIDHFVLYLADASGNLQALDNAIAPSSTSAVIPTATIPSGTWKLYLEMVGVSSIRNQWSAGVTLVQP